MGRITNALNALFDRSVKNAPQPGSVQTSAQLAMVVGMGYGRTPAERPEELIQQGFNKNIVVYRAIREIAQSAASVELILYRKKRNGDLDEITEHEILELMNRPNPRMAQAEFLESWISYYALTGNTYVHGITVRGGKKLQELWPLMPGLVEPLVQRGQLVAYRVADADRGTVDFPVDPVTGQCEILHTKNFNPANPFKGISPLQAAALSVDIHNATSEWNHSLLENGAQPSGALVMTAQPGGMARTLTDPEFDRLKGEIEASHAGARNAGRPLILEGGLDWKQMGLSPKDMDWLNSRNTTAREIALAFGVPPMLLGIPGDNTYSNQKEARLWFWEDTVLPTLSLVLDSLNRFLATVYPNQGLFLGYDEDKISALAPRREDLWKRVSDSEFLTIDEKREAAGYEAIEGGDVLLVKSGSVPLTSAIEPPPDPVALAEAVARAKQPTNDNAPPAASQRVAEEARSFAADLRFKCVEIKQEVKFSDPDWRAVEIGARTKLTSAAENALRIKVKKHLLETGKQAAQLVRSNDVVGIEDLVESRADELEEILQGAYYGIADIVVTRFYNTMKASNLQLERKDLLGRFWDLMARFVEVHTARQVTNINNTTRKAIRQEVAKGQQEGMSYDQIADGILDVFRQASPTRAMTIAVTEAHTASSYAAQASAEASGTDMEREWGAANDSRTRPSHRSADGQKRRMNEPFDIGGHSLHYPGDPDGPAEETVNCRCVVLYHPTL